MTIREIRRDQAASVTDLYLEMCRRLSERDSDWGVPDWDPINRWILRTTESDDAVCLVAEVEGSIVGYLLASVARHPAMPGVLGTLEELHVRPGPSEERLKNQLVDGGITWARDRGASPIQTTVGLGSPWFDQELSFWTSIGFEHDQALVTRYFLEDEGC
jgi:L-amino acid N-acyltransferase YncA